MMLRRSWIATLMLAPLTVMAQGYPTKPVKFIVPYAAGGLPDSVARVVAQRLTERLGQSVVVDNKPGGNGVVAYQALLQSSPQDGHAFIVSDGSMLSITPLLNKAVPYKVGTDILPVSLIARSPLFVVAHPKNGVNTLQEFVSLVKRKPGEYTYGSSGIGSTHHLTMEALKAALSLDVRHVPFKGSGHPGAGGRTGGLLGGGLAFDAGLCQGRSGQGAGQQCITALTAGARYPDGGRDGARF
jgi:tripartite-type tricarboxylate transporter receptor subunit TctC